MIKIISTAYFMKERKNNACQMPHLLNYFLFETSLRWGQIREKNVRHWDSNNILPAVLTNIYLLRELAKPTNLCTARDRFIDKSDFFSTSTSSILSVSFV